MLFYIRIFLSPHSPHGLCVWLTPARLPSWPGPRRGLLWSFARSGALLHVPLTVCTSPITTWLHLQSLLVQCLSSDSESLEVSSALFRVATLLQRSDVWATRSQCMASVAPSKLSDGNMGEELERAGLGRLKRKLLLEPTGDEKLWIGAVTQGWRREPGWGDASEGAIGICDPANRGEGIWAFKDNFHNLSLVRRGKQCCCLLR